MALNALVCFVKAPIFGNVKTRLAKRIGEERALEVYEGFVQHILTLSLPLFCERYIAYDTPEPTLALPHYLERKKLFLQEGDDLGERMCRAFEHLFALGHKKVVLIGSDIPEMNEKIIEDAFAMLLHKDAILSPSTDGGFYLIGFNAKTFTKEAFMDMTYSRHDVFLETKHRLKSLLMGEGKMLRDVDTLEDLKALSPAFPTKRVSVIIPVYHEDETLLHTIDTLYANAKSDDFEVIVVDTVEHTTVDALQVKQVRIGFASKGRASQMNEGAQMAEGDILLFLHADTLVPKRWDALIDTHESAGAFRLSFDSPKPIFKLLALFANLRARLTRIPYGDQGLFFKASAFKEMGGFANIALMEDVEIMKRLKQRGIGITLLDAPIITSSRRWEKEGLFYTTLRNRMLSLLYLCGVSPSKLHHYYPSHKL
jgi:rSAM/selenodomain-associated transferase 2/rSAM/selenodomain-associated transferase 1